MLSGVMQPQRVALYLRPSAWLQSRTVRQSAYRAGPCLRYQRHKMHAARLSPALRRSAHSTLCNGSCSANFLLTPTSLYRTTICSTNCSPVHRVNLRAFSTSRNMSAATIDGTAIARTIREKLHAEIAQKQKSNPRFQPCFKILQGLPVTCSTLLAYRR